MNLGPGLDLFLEVNFLFCHEKLVVLVCFGVKPLKRQTKIAEDDNFFTFIFRRK